MKIFLLIYLIVNGVDMGPPPIEVESIDECQKIASEYLSKGPPDGVDIMRVGCVQEVSHEKRT